MADAKAQIVLSAVNRTQAAFAQVKGQFDQLSATSAAAVARFSALAPVVAGAFAAVKLKGAIDTLDQLDEISEKSGIAVEQLSSLRFAGESVGTTFDELAAGASRLARRIGEAAGGGKEAQAFFDALGVSIKNADGTLRGTDQVLLDIADRFAGYRDGAAKAALAQEGLGRSGEALIPLLNQGRAGIQRLREQAERLGAVYGGELATKAAAFNDDLQRLKLAAEGASVALAGSLVPALGKAAKELVDGLVAYGSFTDALLDIGVRVDPGQTAAENIAQASQRISELEAELGKLERREGLANRFATDAQQKNRLELLQREIRLLKARRQFFESQSGAAPEAGVPGEAKTGAPVMQDGAAEREARAAARAAAAERARALRTSLQGRVELIESSLRQQADAFSFAERSIEQSFAAGNVSLAEFYAERGRLAQAALRQQLDAIDAQVLAERQFAAAAADKGARAEAENRINGLLRERSSLEALAAQDAALSAGEQAGAAKVLQAQLADLNAQVLELGGDEQGGALLRLEQQLKAIAVTVGQAGADSGIVNDLRELGRASAQFNDLRRQQAQVTERAALAEEAYLLESERAGTSQSEVEQGLIARRRESLRQLQELAVKARELAAANPKNQDFEIEAQRLAVAVQQAELTIDPALERIKQRSDDIASAFGNAAGVLANTGSATDALAGLERQLLGVLNQILIVEPATRALRDALGSITAPGAGGGGGAGGFISSLLTSILGSAQGNAFVPEGVVQAFARGSAFANSIVSEPTLFAFERGGTKLGVMGEAGDEAVLPLKRTASGDLGVQVAGSAGGGSMTINVNVQAQPGMSRATALQQGEQVGRGIQRSLVRAG